MKYRVKFTKNGAIKYIGHLDVMRYIQKVIRRSKLPIAYSEGFSPHQILSFAFPLSVGYESDGEYFDMQLTEAVESKIIMQKMNEQMNEGITITAVKELDENARNCMSSVFAAAYTVSVKEKIALPSDFKDKAIDYMSRSTIIVNKPKKKGGGFIEIDLKSFIYEFKVYDDNSVYFIVNASSDNNIKPSFVMECILLNQNISIEENSFSIRRIELYENKGLNEDIKLIPLI